MSELIGQTLGRYQIERVIGEGSIGTVYAAHDDQQRQVAIKVIHPHLAIQEHFQRQFLRDIQLLSSLSHPNLVRVYEAGQTDHWLYMVMEYLEGGSLRQYLEMYIRDQHFAPLPSVIDFVGQIAVGLHYAHDQSIVHQDVKPENILFRPMSGGDFQMAIADLKTTELARDALGSEVLRLESALPYMAPEVCEGRPAEVEADIYSLGIIFYLMVVGRLPFEPRTLAEAAILHRTQPIPPPTSIRQGLPPELEQIIMKCIAKDPAQRYATAARLVRDIQELEIQLQHKYPTNIGMDTDAGFSTVVTFETAPAQANTHTQPEITRNQIGRDRLIVASLKQPTWAVAIDKDVFVVGRDRNADIVLESPTVSRYHVRIQRLEGGYYQVTDLGSSNGSWVGSSQLSANREQPWPPGQFLRVGDFRLLIEPVINLAITQAPVVDIDDSQQVQQDTQPEVEPKPAEPLNISIKLIPEWVNVVPGEQQGLQLEVFNESGIVDHFLIEVSNIPPEWVTVPDASLEILSDADRNRGTVTLLFNPPRESSSIAGAYSFEVTVRSVGQPNALPVVTAGRLQIESFYEFTSDMHPLRLKGNKKPELTIVNTGNTPQTFTITARDDEEALNFFINPATLNIDPGQTATVPISLSPKLRPLLGSSQRYPFTIDVADDRPGSTPKNHAGDLTVNPLFSRRALGLMALLLALCGLGSFCGVSQLLSISNQLQENADLDATSDLQANQTQSALSDQDNDGLANFEEEALGTDPRLPDTDGDGLPDGREVKALGTNPLAIDTDNDTLDDGREVLVIVCTDGRTTSPNNPDTDGDGVPDNVDPNPCQPPTPVPLPIG